MHTTGPLESKHLCVFVASSKAPLIRSNRRTPNLNSDTPRKKRSATTTSSGGRLCWNMTNPAYPLRRPSRHSHHVGSSTSSTMLLASIQARSSDEILLNELCQLLLASTNFFRHTKTS